MEISDQDQLCLDFDWFAVDDQGWIGHFTTAGFKLLPRSVSPSQEDLKLVTGYFERSAPIREGHFVDNEIIPTLKNEKDPERRLRDFVAMANRGLYSYDIESYGDTYFRVAIPKSPMHMSDLPENIQEILKRTRAKGSIFSQCRRIAHAATLSF